MLCQLNTFKFIIISTIYPEAYFMDINIIADLKGSYGITCKQIAPVSGGYLNLKWKVSTEKGDLLVKHFSNKRFSSAKLKKLESALQRQIILNEKGFPCPYIWQCEGRAIRQLGETAYMVMDFRPGKVESPGTITNTQMNSLGFSCGLMHKEFSKLPADSVEGYPIDNNHAINMLWTNFHAQMHDCSSNTPNEYRAAVIAQEPILKQLKNEFFDSLPQGIAHEDFAADNILFYENAVSAIIDFDRNHYSYIWHDIGRAILSFALNDKQLDIEKVHAFLEGYSQHSVLSLPNIVNALRLSWCIEVPWWIHPVFFSEKREKVVRFRDEILWLTEHWFELEHLLIS